VPSTCRCTCACQTGGPSICTPTHWATGEPAGRGGRGASEHAGELLLLLLLTPLSTTPQPSQPQTNSVQDIEAKYYANGEDAYEMRKYFGSATKRRGGRGSSAGGAKRGGKEGAAAATGASEGGSDGGAAADGKEGAAAAGTQQQQKVLVARS